MMGRPRVSGRDKCTRQAVAVSAALVMAALALTSWAVLGTETLGGAWGKLSRTSGTFGAVIAVVQPPRKLRKATFIYQRSTPSQGKGLVDPRSEQAWDLLLADEAAAAKPPPADAVRKALPHRATIRRPAPRRVMSTPLTNAVRQIKATMRRMDRVQESAHQALENLAAPATPEEDRLVELTFTLRVRAGAKDAQTVKFQGWGDFGKEGRKRGFDANAVAIGAYRPTPIEGSSPADGFDALAIMIAE